jgi:uncharacterized protein YjbI with pentapeptide repeats
MPKSLDLTRANPEHLEVFQRGVAQWNAWREANPYVLPVLKGEDFSGRNLAGADFTNTVLSGCKLRSADLSGAELYQAELFRSDLRDANLTEADMRGAKLHQADLRGTLLAWADLFRADFIGTQVDYARFAGSRCEATTFADVDFSKAIGLELANHTGPSSVDIATLRRSGNTVPRAFFVGTGIPATFLDYGLSIIADVPAIEFDSVFISYSSTDEAFAKALYEVLARQQIRVWFAPEDMKPGGRLHDQIDTAIRVYDRLLLILSQSSLRSDWVRTELGKAVRRERREQQRILFPVRIVSYDAVAAWECFDTDLGVDLAASVREYYIPNFENWRDLNAFDAGCAKVISALRNAPDNPLQNARGAGEPGPVSLDP